MSEHFPSQFSSQNLSLISRNYPNVNLAYGTMRSSASLPKLANSSLSTDRNSPRWGFGTSKRFNELAQRITDHNYTPGPVYFFSDKFKYYQNNGPKFPMDKKDMSSREKYDFYRFNHIYNFNDHKKWDKTIGGAITYEKRSDLSNKHNFPGPANYSPEKSIVLDKPPKYSIGEKLSSSLILSTGTKSKVGPGSYDSSNFGNVKTNSPKWSMPVDQRKGIENRSFSKFDTYCIINSCDKQVSSIRRSEPKFSFPRSDREGQSKLLFFDK